MLACSGYCAPFICYCAGVVDWLWVTAGLDQAEEAALSRPYLWYRPGRAHAMSVSTSKSEWVPRIVPRFRPIDPWISPLATGLVGRVGRHGGAGRAGQSVNHENEKGRLPIYA